jgi:hypothetical protein
MILSLAKVQDPSARVYNGNTGYTFHTISEPVQGGLPIYRLAKPRGRK